MIRTEAEYQRTRKSVDESVEHLRIEREKLAEDGFSEAEIRRGLDPQLSFLEQRKEELEEYEKLCRGEIGEIKSYQSTGRLLIALRIARGLSQKQLAERLGVHESAVSRDERNEYHGITIERATRVFEALEAEVSIRIKTPVVPG